MKENFKAISQALLEAGFKNSLENAEGKKLDFKITPYSLNTKLSFRFDSLQDFNEFLTLANSPSSETRAAQIKNAFAELGLVPDQFFYVNFFEAGAEEDE
ncbi:MAG: hypothetical protein EOO51_03035 [Flavobacterium sp.]|nr:MAG: hypothetical protein EOO51_03035 [Flavobacterium sp.]